MNNWLFRSGKYLAGSLVTALMFSQFLQLAAAQEGAVGSSTRGATAWAEQCNRCHNMRDPVEFRDDQWRVIVSHMRVRAGLSGQQARDILAFIQGSNTGYWAQTGLGSAAATAAVAPATQQRSAREVYDRVCVACHGQRGRGTIPGAPDFSASDGPLSKSDAELQQSILVGLRRAGAPLAMPPKGGDPSLTPAEAEGLVEFLRTEFGH